MDTKHHYGNCHVFTGRGEGTVCLKAGAGETLTIDADGITTTPDGGVPVVFTLVEEISGAIDNNIFSVYKFFKGTGPALFGQDSLTYQGISTISALRDGSDLFSVSGVSSLCGVICGGILYTSNIFKEPDYVWTGREWYSNLTTGAYLHAICTEPIYGVPDQLSIVRQSAAEDQTTFYYIMAGTDVTYSGYTDGFQTYAGDIYYNFAGFSTNYQEVTKYQKWISFNLGTYVSATTAKKPISEISIRRLNSDATYLAIHSSGPSEVKLYDEDALLIDLTWYDTTDVVTTELDDGLTLAVVDWVAGTSVETDDAVPHVFYAPVEDIIVSRVKFWSRCPAVLFYDDQPVVSIDTIGQVGEYVDYDGFSAENCNMFICGRTGLHQFEWNIVTDSTSTFVLAGILDGVFTKLSDPLVGNTLRASGRIQLNSGDKISVFIDTPVPDGAINLDACVFNIYSEYDTYFIGTSSNISAIGTTGTTTTVAGNIFTDGDFTSTDTIDLDEVLVSGLALYSSVTYDKIYDNFDPTGTRISGYYDPGLADTIIYKGNTSTQTIATATTVATIEFDQTGFGIIGTNGVTDYYSTDYGASWTNANVFATASVFNLRYLEPIDRWFAFTATTIYYGRKYATATINAVDMTWPSSHAWYDVASNGTTVVLVSTGTTNKLAYVTLPSDAEDAILAASFTNIAGRTVDCVRIVWSRDAALYCAVGGLQVSISADGITWTHTTVAYALTDVVWCPGFNAFVGMGARLAYSYDGITWTYVTATNPAGNAFAAQPALGGSLVWINDTLWLRDEYLFYYTANTRTMGFGNYNTDTTLSGNNLSITGSEIDIVSDIVKIGGGALTIGTQNKKYPINMYGIPYVNGVPLNFAPQFISIGQASGGSATQTGILPFASIQYTNTPIGAGVLFGWDTTNYRWIPNQSGYFFVICIGLSASVSANHRLRIQKNGTIIATGNQNTAVPDTVTVQTVVFLDGHGDYIDINADLGSFDFNTYTDANVLTIFKIY